MLSLRRVAEEVRRHRIVGGLAAAFLFWLAVGRLDQTLRLLHTAGSDGGGVEALSRGTGRAEAAVQAWDEFGQLFIDQDLLRMSGTTIAMLALLLEIGLTITLGLLLLMLGRWLAAAAGRSVGESGEGDEPDADAALGSPATDDVTVVQVLPLVRKLLVLAIVVDITDNLLALLMLIGINPIVALLLQWLRWAKLLLVAIVVVSYAITIASLAWNKAKGAGRLVPWFSGVFRVQVIVVALFAAATTFGFPAEQTQDAARLWLDEPLHALVAFAALVGFSVALAAGASRLLRRPALEQIDPHPVVILAVGGAIAALGGLTMWWWEWGPGLASLGAVIFAIGALSWPIDMRPVSDLVRLRPQEAVEVSDGDTVIRIIAAIPWLVTAGMLLRAGITDWMGTGFSPGMFAAFVVAVAGCVLVPAVLAVDRVWAPLSGEGRRAPTSAAHDSANGDELPAVVKRGSRSKLLWTAVVSFGLLHIAIVRSPIWFPRRIGTIGLTTLFAIEVVVVLGLLGHLAMSVRPPAVLRLVGSRRRLPIISVLVVWGLVGAWFDGGSTQHDVRLSAPVPDREPLDFQAYYSSWIDASLLRHGELPASVADDGELRAIPLVLVATHGGGIKAASWTSLVLDCAVGTGTTGCPDRGGSSGTNDEAWENLSSVFVMSGASGGTVGLATLTTERLAAGGDDAWVHDRLSTDLLSPSLAWQLFVEAPMALPRARSGTDRAEVIERAWSGAWDGETSRCTEAQLGEDPFYQRWTAWTDADADPRCRIPVVLSNGASLLDGCLVNISTFNDPPTLPDVGCGGGIADEEPYGGADEAVAEPSGADAPEVRGVDRTYAWDVGDLLCSEEDLAVSTAAFLSARFPFVSPTGRLVGAERRRDDCPHRTDGSVIYIGDGGYRDNTGASGIIDVLAELAPVIAAAPEERGVCVVPIVIEISSGYRDDVAPSTNGRIFESIAPLSGAMSVFGSRDRADPELLVSVTSGSQVGGYEVQRGDVAVTDRHVRFELFSAPGAQAPLGWLLSNESSTSLEKQLSAGANAAAFGQLDDLLEPGALSCRPQVGE